ncbi:hypothetical protein ONZ51_g1150 [Trametes cubensis]|uniref:Uncharacterized protein n=1 Tax=Trametes cubensis TaxID=1111947 RepID=A0AAD7U4D5_9APHY|nr:hypothetical protein ONZ51_g1150 [Trametes cubensis]
MSNDQVVYMKDKLEHVLSPKSPVVADAVFGSAPRPRRPSTPKSPPTNLPQTSASAKKDKALPPVPGLSSPPSAHATTTTPARTRSATKRSDSPDVETMIARTPRPRRKSSATFNSPILRARSNSSMMVPSSWKGLKGKEAATGDNESVISDYGTLLKDDDSDLERQLEGDGSESDSSLDIHTPLPHLMFRDGLLSPRSKLLPGGAAPLSLYIDDNAEAGRANSVLSVASTAASTMTKSGVYRDPRDTQRRRNRHKDQSLLRAGMGLTTGLGWSDSEDEDAPSLLTRRLITTSLARQPTVSSSARAPSQLTKSTSVGNLSHPPPSYSPAPRLGTRTLSRSSSASFSNSRLSIADTESVTSVDAEPITRGRTQSNASASSVVSSGSRESSVPPQSVASSQTSQGRTTVPRPLRLPQMAGKQAGVSRSTSISDSRPPVTGMPKAGGPRPHTRTRTLSNPSRVPGPGTSALPRPGASKIVPPRSVSAAVMAPIRSRSISTTTTSSITERSSVMSDDTISDFPLPPGQLPTPSTPVRSFARPSPSVNTQVARSMTTSPVTPPSARVLNTVGTGPRPRIGNGMTYRSSSTYSSMYETTRLSRASIASPGGKQVGVI